MRLVVEDLGHRFSGSPWLFRSLSWVFEPGNTYAITGPSGSGKSTLMSLISGWQRPSEGAVHKTDLERTSWVFQSPHGTARRSAVDLVAFPFLASGLPRREADERSRDLLARFGLDSVADSEFRSLSGGEAQRLMLARAIASRPQLILVDEPTAQLDSATSARVNQSISQLAGEGRIVLIATHDEHTRDSCTHHLDLHDYAHIDKDRRES